VEHRPKGRDDFMAIMDKMAIMCIYVLNAKTRPDHDDTDFPQPARRADRSSERRRNPAEERVRDRPQSRRPAVQSRSPGTIAPKAVLVSYEDFEAL